MQPDSVSMWRKLVAGSHARRTRLHDELGETVSFSRLLRNAPQAVWTSARAGLTGQRPNRPWISYDGQAALAAFLTPQSKVLEFGSGMSTLWYARHAGHVVSIESDQAWFGMIGERISQQPNVDYRFAETLDAYIGAAPDQLYDLIMIDGRWRDSCADFAMRHLAPGGVIYLDNADKSENPYNGSVPRARADLQAFARDNRLPIRSFTDFAPCQMTANLGLMIGGPAVGA